MRIVLDTNCLIQSIGFHSEFRHVWESFLCGKLTLCISNDIIEEYSEILQRLFGLQFAELVISTILKSPFAERITPHYHFNLISADPDDNKFVDCAITANAHYIVTNDRHFDVLFLVQFPHVDVVTLKRFAEFLLR